jgi:FkbM family methyltransferase
MGPGADAIVPMVVEAPPRPGRYVLEIDLVHEFVRWLGCAVRVEIDVRAPEGAPGLALPGGAPRWLASADPEFFDRVTRLCSMEHDEARTLLFRPGSSVDVPIRALGDHMVRLRPGTSDVRLIDNTFWGRYHLPPPELGVPGVIVDLGSNIGLTMSHFAHLFPSARIAGVELDSENAGLCRRNVAPWSDRCTVVHAAVWSDGGEVAYDREPDEAWAYHIGGQGDGEQVTVEAKTLDAVLESVAPDETVDFLKVDIEGAEQNLLEAGGEWTERVRMLKVETHEPYSVGACLQDLSRIGFSARPDDAHWGAVVARRA